MFWRRMTTQARESEIVRSNETCPVMRSRLGDVIDPVLMDEEGVPVFTEKTLRKETTLRLNKRLYLEWEDEESIVEEDLVQVMFYNLIDEDNNIGIEINSVLPNSSHQKVQKLFFKKEEDREKVAMLLQHKKDLLQKKITFVDVVNMYLQREFQNMKPRIVDGVKKVKKEEIRTYFKRSGMDLPRNALSENMCSFEDWKKAYEMMMDQQSSKTLRSMFEHYSVWGGENAPRKMKQKNFEDFLAKHQQEGDRYNSEEVAGILSRHKIQVEVLKEQSIVEKAETKIKIRRQNK